MNPSEFYRMYTADNTMTHLNNTLVNRILQYYPASVLEFGCGTGKHLKSISELRPTVHCVGIDISLMNIIYGKTRNDLESLILGNESMLPRLGKFDVVFTCSVLDHIEDVHSILDSFKALARNSVILAETNDKPGEFYYPHDYEFHGFRKIDFEWISIGENGDGARYNIWIWHNERHPNHEDFPY